jgi:hypothetical protein
VAAFRTLFPPSIHTPFIVFSQVEKDGSETDLVAITRRNELSKMLEALSASGARKIDIPTV